MINSDYGAIATRTVTTPPTGSLDLRNTGATLPRWSEGWSS